MESEIKIEAKAELEDPEVNWDCKYTQNVEINTVIKVEPESMDVEFTETKPLEMDAACITSNACSIEEQPFYKECEIEIKVEPGLLSDESWSQGIESVASNSYMELGKNEVKEELENPGVDQDAKAEEIVELSTIVDDLELSTDSPSEHDSSETHKYEQPMSTDYHMKSDEIEVNKDHQKATSCLKDGVEECPHSSSGGLLVKTDESITLDEELKLSDGNLTISGQSLIDLEKESKTGANSNHPKKQGTNTYSRKSSLLDDHSYCLTSNLKFVSDSENEDKEVYETSQTQSDVPEEKNHSVDEPSPLKLNSDNIFSHPLTAIEEVGDSGHDHGDTGYDHGDASIEIMHAPFSDDILIDSASTQPTGESGSENNVHARGVGSDDASVVTKPADESGAEKNLMTEKSSDIDADTASVVAEFTDKSSSMTEHIMSWIISKSASNQRTIDYVNQEKFDGSTPKKTPDESISETTETSKLSLNQLKKYYKWCILGFSSSEALSKAKEPGLIPETDDPHPDCKFTFEEIKQISLLIQAKHPRNRFVVETFFGGKDPEKQLKLALSSSKVERHPDCKGTWEDLKKISAELPKEAMKMKFMVETFYEGKEPDIILKSMLPNRPTTSLRTAENANNEQSLSSSHEKVSGECISEPEISQLNIDQLKKYYQWCILGFSSSEALLKAKESGKPPSSGSHPNCKVSFEELKQIYLLFPVKNKARQRFFIETFFGGKDLEKQLKLAFSSLKKDRHSDCKRTWEELKKMCAELPKESMKMKFMVETFYEGKEPDVILKTLLPNRPTTSLQTAEKSSSEQNLSSSHEKVSDECISEPEISQVNIDQLKRYYQWCILGFSSSEALLKAKESAKPPTSGSHPNCKLSFGELKQIYLLFPVKNKATQRFFIETFFGGKDLEKQFKLAFSRLNKERHPDCKRSWEELMKMCAKLPRESIKMKFMVETFYEGKDPEKILKAVLPNRPATSLQTAEKADKSVSESEISKLSLNQLKKYYKWRILGVACNEALVKAKEPGLIPQIEDHHPDCKLPWEEIKEISLLVPAKHPRALFQVETFLGGKDVGEQLKLALVRANAKHNPGCKHLWDDLEKMSKQLPKESSRWKFVVESFYGGKSPAELLKNLLSNVTDSTSLSAGDVHYIDGTVGKAVQFVDGTGAIDLSYADTFDYPTIIEDGPISKLPNGKLKLYYLWRNAGLGHENALSKASNFENCSGRRLAHPKCMLSMVELTKMAQALSSETISRDRFLIHTYFGGKDPECTMKYFMSNPRRTHENVVANKPECSLGENISSIEELNLSNGLLKYYFLWRNKGCTHSRALSNVQQRIKIPGTHYPHPNCKHSEDQLRHISQALKLNKFEWDRYIVYTYYGGKDPEVTLQYFLLRLGKARQPGGTVGPSYGNVTLIDENNPRRTHENVAANQSEGSLGENISSIEELNLSNDLLKYYFLWCNTGYTHSMALSNVQHRIQIPGTHYPHPNCKYSEDQLRHISQALKSNKFEWDRFLIYTYYGGKDPEVTLRYFLSSLGKAGQPDAAVGSSDENFTLIDENTLGNNKLMLYYLWRNDGCDHETALLKLKKVSRKMKNKVNIFGKYRPHPDCKHTEEELRRISEVLKSDITKWHRFFIHTYYGGKDPECTLKYLMPKCKDIPDGCSKKTMKNVSFQFEPVAKRTRSRPDSGIIPLDSPSHPSKELSDAQVKNYYLWFNQGFSREEAIVKAKTPGLIPRRQRSRCLVPMEDLKSMSMKLPPGKLREIFITETHYAGNDPEYLMEYLLSKASSNSDTKPPSLLPQTPIQKPTSVSQQPSNQDDHTAIENKPADSEVKRAQCESTDTSNPTIIEEGPMNHMSTADLKYYYLWRNKGCDIEQAMLNMKNKVKFPGWHSPHTRCKHLEKDLNRMAEALPLDKRARFVVHTFYGGKDPECTINYLTTHSPFKGASKPKGISEKQPQLQKHENQHIIGTFGPNPSVSHGLPAVPPPVQWPPLGHSAVGMPTAELDYQPPAVGLPQAVMPYQHQAAGPPTMAYLPPPDAVPSMVQLYGQLVPDPPSMAYSPNQYIAAPVAYLPPSTSVVYSEHPHGAVGPFGCPPIQPPPIPPPVPQQPPAFTNSAINTKSAPAQSQSQNTKAGETLVGKHDPKLSSLKRKVADELPIKIKLKSTSDELKQPKQILKEETPPELDSSAPVFIVPTSYPKESLSESQMDAIESNLLEAILEMDDDGTKPSFKDTNRSNGQYGITCVDQFSVNWLYKFLNTYCPWPGASLKLINTKIRANAVLPPCKGDDDTKILKYIGRQNKGLNVGMWTVVQRWDNGDFNTCIDLVIDEESAKTLQKSSRISFKLGTAEIITSKKGTPPTSRLGDENTSKKPSDSSEKPSASTSYSYLLSPPPPKCIRTGKGYPSLLKSSNETDSTSGSPLGDRERSKRAEDGSPHKNSACRSPYQDRFSCPISKTQASDDVDDDRQVRPWLDWFNSKKDTSSRSPSRKRNPSPEEYRRSKRRRSDSRSPSPKYRRSRHRTPSHDRYVRESPYPKKRKRVASPSPSSSSSDSYSSSGQRRKDSRHKPARHY